MNKIFKITVFSLVFLITVILISFLMLRRTPYPDIILITVDALRADHLSCYGYKRMTSPNIDSLAKEGSYFLNCFATSSDTAHATPALLTGRYLGVSIQEFPEEYNDTLDKKFITLAEYLKSFGYYTTAFVNQGIYRVGTGFEQGFNYYDNKFASEGYANVITTRVLNFLNNYRTNKPLFVWIHYVDVHAPYSAPKKYFEAFEGDALYKENDKILKLSPEKVYPPYSSCGYIPQIIFHKNKYNFNYYVALYDAEILYTDFYIGQLLKNIKDGTIVILTADHGESLGEHNSYFSHGEDIYDEELHIPLIIKDGKYFKGGGRISKTVSSTDIVPTILNRINPAWFFFNKYKFDGNDIKILSKGKDMKRRYIYSYNPWLWSIRDVNKNIKYVLNKYSRKEELYFTPDEQNNLVGNNSLEIASFKQELIDNLKSWLSEDYPILSDVNSKKVSLDEDTRNNLKSLGYLQ